MNKEIKIKLPNGKTHISPSSAKHLANHPLSYLAYANNKFEPSVEMLFGVYYEDFLYGVDTSDRFFIFDDNALCEKASKEYEEQKGKPTNSIRSTTIYKQMYDEVMKGAEGKHILTEEDHDRALKMGLIMNESGVFDEWLDGETQVTTEGVICTDKYIIDKALVRSDAVLPNGKVVDLKTTSKDLDAWVYHAKTLGYDVQAFISMEVYGIDEFTFIVQRTKGLHDILEATVVRDGWFFDSGKRKVDEAMDNYLSFFSESAIKLGAEPSHYIKRKTI